MLNLSAFFKNKLWLFLGATLLLSACGPLQWSTNPPDPEAIYTAAAQTVVAQASLSAGQTAIAQLTQMAQTTPGSIAASPTATVVATQSSPTNPPASAVIPSITPALIVPTVIVIPPTPTHTPAPLPCDWAQFVKDVTVPDGTVFLPGVSFVKTWRIRNAGSCTWTPAYSLVFTQGDRMYANNLLPLPGIVRPGDMVDLSVSMTAPSVPGIYRSYWMLSNAYGQLFGIGPNANIAFWVEIQVQATSIYPFDFSLSMCTAVWSSNSRAVLPCPGNENSADGSVIMLTDPKLENDRRENESTLWTRPSAIVGGWITGVYPRYRVQSGDHFMADIGCLYDNPKCDVTFSVSYQIEGQPIKSLGAWREIYDGKLTRLDIDLSGLAGQSAQFILSVTNHGKPEHADAFWLVPSIRRVSSSTDWQTIPAVKAAIQYVAAETGLSASQFSVLSVTPVDWKDTCLEVQQPDQICAPAIIPGYRIILSIQVWQMEVHTNQDGTIVVWF